MSDIIEFFDQYAKAMETFDSKALTGLYRLPCLFVYPEGQTAYLSQEDLLANMRTLLTHYQEQGLSQCQHRSLAVEQLGKTGALVKVIWSMRWNTGIDSAAMTELATQFQLSHSEGNGWQAVVVTALGFLSNI